MLMRYVRFVVWLLILGWVINLAFKVRDLLIGKPNVPIGSEAVQPTVLEPGERQRLSVDLPSGRVSFTNEKGTVVKEGIRHAQVSVTREGEIKVSARNYGFAFEPGIGVQLGSGGPRVGVDATVAYYRRFDLLVGVSFSNRIRDTAGYLALGYNPRFHLLTNTDLYVGISTRKEPVVGLRVAF